MKRVKEKREKTNPLAPLSHMRSPANIENQTIINLTLH